MLNTVSQAASVELPVVHASQGSLFDNPIAQQAFAVEVLERSDIELLPVLNIADALEWVAGIDVRQRGNGTNVNVSVRGAGHEQTLIMVDGVRMNDPQTGHHNFNLPIVLEDIERIEIVRGPGAGQFGPNGNAGVINLVTRKTVDTASGRQVGVKLEAGSYQYRRGLLTLGKTEGEWSHFVSAQQQESDTYIRGADLGYRTQQGNYRLSHQAEQHSTVFGVGYLDKQFGTQGFYGPATARANEVSIQRHAYVTHDHRVTAQQSIDVAINYRQHDDRFYYLSDAPSEHQTNALQTRLRYRLSDAVAIGYERNQERIESNRIVGNKHKRDYNSVFFYGHHDFERAQLAGSVSYLTYSDSQSYVLPVLGLTLPFADHQLYLNGGKSVRVPTMNDLYLNQTANKGNPDVKPEQTTSAELGLRLHLLGLQTRLATFTRKTTDAIDFTRSQQDLDNNVAFFTARNIDSIDTHGVEVELDASNLLAQYGWQKVSLGYTWLDQEFTNPYPVARYTLSQLVHQVMLGLSYEIAPGYIVSSQTKYEDRYNQDGFVLWDVALIKRHKGWHWGVTANNILDKEYIDNGSIEAPGRTFRFEIAAGF
ncbi:MAG: TonB-dependent receptor [Bacterioplanes sp.]|nr:TonB-dependent receptor [Bacterioplanes sp.]